jgi:hypothetical protein
VFGGGRKEGTAQRPGGAEDDDPLSLEHPDHGVLPVHDRASW